MSQSGQCCKYYYKLNYVDSNIKMALLSKTAIPFSLRLLHSNDYAKIMLHAKIYLVKV